MKRIASLCVYSCECKLCVCVCVCLCVCVCVYVRFYDQYIILNENNFCKTISQPRNQQFSSINFLVLCFMCFCNFLGNLACAINFLQTTYTLLTTTPTTCPLPLLCNFYVFAKNLYDLFCTSTTTTIENPINLFCTTFSGENNKLRFRVYTTSVLSRK